MSRLANPFSLLFLLLPAICSAALSVIHSRASAVKPAHFDVPVGFAANRAAASVGNHADFGKGASSYKTGKSESLHVGLPRAFFSVGSKTKKLALEAKGKRQKDVALKVFKDREATDHAIFDVGNQASVGFAVPGVQDVSLRSFRVRPPFYASDKTGKIKFSAEETKFKGSKMKDEILKSVMSPMKASVIHAAIHGKDKAPDTKTMEGLAHLALPKSLVGAPSVLKDLRMKLEDEKSSMPWLNVINVEKKEMKKKRVKKVRDLEAYRAYRSKDDEPKINVWPNHCYSGWAKHQCRLGWRFGCQEGLCWTQCHWAWITKGAAEWCWAGKPNDTDGDKKHSKAYVFCKTDDDCLDVRAYRLDCKSMCTL